jgi:tetratricopeptide (TPR) repeat protein
LKPRRDKPKQEPLVSSPTLSQPSLSKTRLWQFRLVAISFPLLLLGVLEIALRICGYGYSTDFFKKLKIGNEDYLVQNDDFGLRFFPKETARNPAALRIKAKKPQGTIRIFIFGESAAMGDPEPAFGASRYLEVLLRERFPATKFETVNVAFTAINSHVILPIARECARYEGDVWIVYIGNNEMVGPFGAATVFGLQAPPMFLVKLVTSVQKARVGQLFMALARKFHGSPAKSPSWGGMQMFLENQIAPDNPRKERVYRNFEENLSDILRAGVNAKAKIVLNTIAVNLKDSPPFASVLNSNAPAPDRDKFEEALAKARTRESQRDFLEAAKFYDEAVKLQPFFADGQYHLAECLLASTNFAAARQQFQAACDNDALPFRADARINASIRKAASQFSTDAASLLDASEVLATNSPINLCGQESFYEHVHFNFDGNYRLALAWANAVEKFLPHNAQAKRAADWASQYNCERQLGLTDWNRAFVLQSLIRRFQQPPLSSQFNNAERLAALENQEKEFRRHMTLTNAPAARQLYLEAIQREPNDFLLRENYANFLEAQADWKEAAAQWRLSHDLIPHDFLPFFQLGRMLAQMGQHAEAKTSLERAVSIRPTLAEAWFELGKLRAADSEFPSALDALDRAWRLRPRDSMYCSYKAKILAKLGRTAEALKLLSEATKLSPGNWEAHNAFADELANAGRSVEAAAEYETVTRLRPDFAMAHLNLGVMLVKLGRPLEGAAKFEQVLRLEPGNSTARDYLQRVRAAEAQYRASHSIPSDQSSNRTNMR